MTVSEKKQKGLTFITIMIILGVLAFFVMLILKIGPIYMNHNKIQSAIAAVEAMPDVHALPKYEVRATLAKRMNMNYVDKITVNDFVITKRMNYLKVELDYEKVEKLMGNLSVLVEFSESFEAGEE